MKKQHSQRVVSVVLFLVSIAIGLLMAEIGVRGYHKFFDEGRKRVERANKMFPTENTLYGGKDRIPFNFRPQSSGLYRGIPIQINRHGFRERETGPKREGVYRVAIIGDSIVFGHGVALDETIGRQLETLLNEREGQDGPRFEVLNFGIPGTTAFEQYLVLQEAIGFDLDLVIWVYYLNDPDFKSWNRDISECGVKIAFTEAAAKKLSKVSQLAALVFERTKKLILRVRFGSPHDGFLLHEESHAGFRCTKKSIAEGGRLLSENRIPAVFAVYPAPYAVGRDYPFVSIHKKMIDIGREAGFSPLDLEPAYSPVTPKEVIIHELDPHPNGFANAIAAKRILHHIRRQALIPVGIKGG